MTKRVISPNVNRGSLRMDPGVVKSLEKACSPQCSFSSCNLPVCAIDPAPEQLPRGVYCPARRHTRPCCLVRTARFLSFASLAFWTRLDGAHGLYLLEGMRHQSDHLQHWPQKIDCHSRHFWAHFPLQSSSRRRRERTFPVYTSS